MNIISIRKEKGFSILAVIFVIVAVIVAIGVWALSGTTSSSTGSDSNGDLLASTIINDSNSVKAMHDEAMISRGMNSASVTYVPGVLGSTNLLDPSTGNQAPRAPKNAIRSDAVSPSGFYVFTKTVNGNTIGTSALDSAIVIAGVKTSVCQRINNQVNGITTIPAIAGVTSGALFFTGATEANPMSTKTIDLSSQSDVQGWIMGCVSANGAVDDNLFFRILKVN